MRTFLAINPPAEVRAAAWAATAPLRESVGNISWVSEAKIHLTLKFLGPIAEAAIGPLSETMSQIARSHAPPMVQIASIGAFPHFRNPRVIWIGVAPEPRLELLHHDVEVACAGLGYELEGRPFRPHLTLGRVRGSGSPAALARLRAAAKEIRFSDEFLVQSIDVMQTVPGPGPSTYKTLHVSPMKGR